MNRTNHALSTIGWGLYCACSWTWCIGMFLPIILLRQFGWWGFIAFAIPNIIGCAAFAYVINKKKSEKMLQKHISAMRWFSYIVIAYHMFFIPFLLSIAELPLPDYFPPGLESSLSLVIVCIVLVAAYAMSFMSKRLWLFTAAIIYTTSLVTFAQLGLSPLEQISFIGELPGNQLPWIALVFILGFLLCPYLDLTFHRARHESSSKHSFGVFGVTFSVMILLTCAYSNSIAEGLTPLLTTHIFLQMIFTLAAHISQLRHTKSSISSNLHPALFVGGILVAIGSWAIQVVNHPLIIGEEFYMRFLLFFGLIFPAYILLFMGPGKTLQRSRSSSLWYLFLVLISIPIYETGFFHGYAWLLVLPIAGLLTWKLFLYYTASKTPDA